MRSAEYYVLRTTDVRTIRDVVGSSNILIIARYSIIRTHTLIGGGGESYDTSTST
jgi:hypothetical protein